MSLQTDLQKSIYTALSASAVPQLSSLNADNMSIALNSLQTFANTLSIGIGPVVELYIANYSQTTIAKETQDALTKFNQDVVLAEIANAISPSYDSGQ